MNRNILCIDLKSFFASCECVDRKLDPYTTPLVVCDPTRDGAITLAVTPYLKKFGVPSRGRAYELPKDLNIIKVPPRMKLYQTMSMEVVKIYLSFVAKEDLHIYSIDECFLDVTSYLKMYNKTDYELALDILNTVKNKLGLTATAGIGPNMLLAKVAMDIEAKHCKDNIAKWSYNDVKEKLWKIKPLSKMWGIGPRMEAHLNELGFYSIGDIAISSKDALKQKFGILGEELWKHTNGIDDTKISDLKNQIVKEKSISHSQILYKDYYDFNITLIIYELIDKLCRELRKAKQTTQLIGFGITYSKTIGTGFYHSVKLSRATDDVNEIYKTCMTMFDKYYINNYPIRKVAISFSKLQDNSDVQLNLFENFEEKLKTKQVNSTIDEIKERFGANSLLNASSLLEDSTVRERNNKIGGHDA